ncbi:glycosyltransferase family 2 protein [Vibrio vulnificus]|uniref:glycosyltransferase family 2 protein n=1 Tax=Vibrio vulnificus TaxID=672 RepID=UPI001A31D6ED|nr:glycosyltransferase [Vibrio vulnificus]MDS1828742.1 glycosyltransferase [Vibrio vulnificus]HAS8319001.1 glycosyltransferase [Vibrio vulnificus]
MILSIVIPTKGRNEYLIKTIRTILDMDLSNVEILIQDNNEIDEISSVFEEEISFGLVSYFHEPKPLSFVDNFELAISRVKGDYITLIGDDDLINPEIIDVVTIAQEKSIDAIVPANKLHFLWPNSNLVSRTLNGIASDSILFTIKKFGGSLELVNSRKELEKVLKNGGVDYLKSKMPRLYHGIVCKEVIDKIRTSEGRVFGGLTPDIYVSSKISQYADKVVFFDYPLTIPGACNKSGSVASATGAHTGLLKEAPHFKYRGDYEWNGLVPKIYSVETIWADTVFASVSHCPDLTEKIDTSLLNSICYYKYKSLREYQENYHLIFRFLYGFKYAKYWSKSMLFIISEHVRKRFFKNQICHFEVKTPMQVIKELENYTKGGYARSKFVEGVSKR